MRPNRSSLNPNAPAYVPVAKKASNNASQSYENMLRSCARSAVYGTGNLPASADSKLKGQATTVSPGFSSQSSHGMSDRILLDELSEIDLAYLEMMYPGLSKDSLLEVYHTSMGDLEASLDMLRNLVEDNSVANLPEALDIGDVPQPGFSGESSSARVKNVVDESSKRSDPADAAWST
ncbi:hypothetical protein Droror1_Dr00017203 [Drosera rotundifolia]